MIGYVEGYGRGNYGILVAKGVIARERSLR